eukprot:4667140-Lingulodinium_polyedra.AAC.1
MDGRPLFRQSVDALVPTPVTPSNSAGVDVGLGEVRFDPAHVDEHAPPPQLAEAAEHLAPERR